MTLQQRKNIDGTQACTARIAEVGHIILSRRDHELYSLLEQEYGRQQDTLYMVAASSMAHPATLVCGGMATTNVTTEGYPGARFHGGCHNVDGIERLAIERAKAAFNAQYANVQPHSGTSANLIVLFSMLNPGDTILGMGLDAGGHLSHGSPVSITGRFFNTVQYGVSDSGWLDYEQARALAREHRPKLIVCGASSYARQVNYAEFRTIADEVDAWLLADISHVSGLVAGGVHPSPIEIADFTTTSTYKQLFGPRGGLILMGSSHQKLGPDGKQSIAATIQKGVFPLLQGTPDLSAIAGKAAALQQVATPAFRLLSRRIVDNALTLTSALEARGYRFVTGGTDTHMALIDLRGTGLSGAAAERALEACGIIVNKNMIPGDPTSARVTSGVRLGTNILSLRGMGDEQMLLCAELFDEVLRAVRSAPASPIPETVHASIRGAVTDLCRAFPVPDYPLAIEEPPGAME
jgi:glycine hydroxymethyltransferase